MKKGAWIEVPKDTFVCRAELEELKRSKRRSIVRVFHVGWGRRLGDWPMSWRDSGQYPTHFIHLVAWKGSGGYLRWCGAGGVREVHELELLARVAPGQ